MLTRERSSTKLLPAGLVGIVMPSLLLAGRAQATDCTTLPSPVYTGGSTAAKIVLAEVAAVVAGQGTPITVVYLSQGSCVGVSTVFDKTLVSTPTGTTGAFTYWSADGTANTCDVAAPGVQLDIGLSDVFAETCLGALGSFPSFLSDNTGPVQAMTFAVPNDSPEKSISVEAAYFTFGFGSASGVTPWNQVGSIFQRGPGSGTQGMIGTAINVPIMPSNAWYGVVESSTTNMIKALASANGTPAAASTIGILAAEDADANRATVHELAYRHTGQSCGYLPDSTAGLFDKRNVRDGHYAIWGPMHLIQRTDIDNQANITTIIQYMTGTKAPPGVDLIQFEAASHVIPQCAMRVKRTAEMGPLLKNDSSLTPCGCYYEYSADAQQTSCTPCTSAAQCPATYSCPQYTSMGTTVGWCEPP